MNKIFLRIVFLLLPILTFGQTYDAEVINQSTDIVINRNRITREVKYEIQINNRDGERYTKIRIPFSDLNKVSNINAFIIDADGMVVSKLRNREIVDKSLISDFSLYEDHFIKEFTLKHNTYPYTLIYSYKVQENEFLYIHNWLPVISERIPTRNAALQVTVPDNYKINYVNHFIEEPIVSSYKNTIQYTWRANYTNTLKQETFSPSITKLLPRVSITPDKFYFEEKGSFESWTTYGNWQEEIMHGLTELPDSEKNRVLSLTKDIEDNKEKIKVLFHYLQDETRYINVSIGTGGMKPYPAAYVAQNKYGDCKALTNYFKSLLDFLEIKSYYAKVYAGSPNEEIDKSFPSQQFNHVILYIPLEEEDLWLDLTSDGPFNYLGTFTQDRYAFVVTPNNSHFLKTPTLLSKDVLETRKITIDYNEGDAYATFKNEYKGKMFERLSEINASFTGTDRTKVLRRYFIENGFDLTDYQISELKRDMTKIDLSYKAESKKIYNHYGNDVLISNITFSLPSFENPNERKSPIQIDYPIYKKDTITYKIPEGYTLNKNFDNFTKSNKYGKYSFTILAENNEIRVIKSLLIHSGYYPISEYKDFYSFYEEVRAMENKKQLVLNK